MYKQLFPFFIVFSFIFTACEKRPDLTPLVIQLDNQIADFDSLAQEILAHPGISSIYAEPGKEPSFHYENNLPPNGNYSFPITLEALPKIGSDSVVVNYTDSAEVLEITGIKIGKEFIVPTVSFGHTRGIVSGWAYLTASPEPNLIMSSSICYKDLLDKYVNVNQFPDQDIQIEIYLPTKNPKWYIYCYIHQPNPN
jgi:hypothetical protein